MQHSSGIERDEVAKVAASGFLLPAGRHFRLIQVELRDGSDLANAFVQERQWLLHTNEALALSGNLFVLEDLLDDSGTIFVLDAPLPHARPAQREWDLRVLPCRHDGIRLELADPPPGASWTRLDSQGGPLGRARVFQDWQRSRRPDTPSHRAPTFLSNTWGDRSRDARMCQAFMEGEIDLAAELGVDVVQLDDGWERGVTVNSSAALDGGGVWEGFWNSDPDFWSPHPQRFPNGLEPLVERARAKGVALGLWFAPDSWDDFCHWRRDADCILDLHRRLGVRHFKLDGIKTRSQTALDRLRAFIDAVLSESDGEVVFDLDITAEIRPGPFGLMQAGVLFVENRYTDWHSYWPHHTLRMLWQLSRWIDPLRLRVEFLNHRRCTELYEGDPLAPAAYPPATLFATAMAANPLGWFEISGLSPEYRAEVGALCRVWKTHRRDWFQGTLLPLGDCPDGRGLSGFVSVAPDGRSLLALFFRGLGERGQRRIDAPFALPAGTWTTLAGEGQATVDEDSLRVTLPQKLGYLFGRLGRD